MALFPLRLSGALLRSLRRALTALFPLRLSGGAFLPHGRISFGRGSRLLRPNGRLFLRNGSGRGGL